MHGVGQVFFLRNNYPFDILKELREGQDKFNVDIIGKKTWGFPILNTIIKSIVIYM